MKSINPNIATIIAVAMVAVSWSETASSVPAFARKYSMACSTCHTAYPQLNGFGRTFKENGYRLGPEGPGNKKISDFLRWDEHVPISAIVVSRPFDKKDSGSDKIRALHEVELIVSGEIADMWSIWFELEAEDENDFSPEVANGSIDYNYSKAFNVQLAYAPVFWADPYGFLGDHFRMTRGHVKVLDERFGHADGNGRLRDSRQMIGIYGRPTDRLFYNFGISGLAKDTEGQNPGNLHGRLAFDVRNNMMLGLFGITGQDDVANRDFSRIGADFNAEFGDLRLQGAYVFASDDQADGTDEDNRAYSLQSYYAFKNGGRARWVPLFRFDSYERNDGQDRFDEMTLNLSYYFSENIKAYIEYWDQIDSPESVDKDSRVTAQLVVGF